MGNKISRFVVLADDEEENITMQNNVVEQNIKKGHDEDFNRNGLGTKLKSKGKRHVVQITEKQILNMEHDPNATQSSGHNQMKEKNPLDKILPKRN